MFFICLNRSLKTKGTIMSTLSLSAARVKKSWKAIPEFPGYTMSSDKEVRNPNGKIIKQRLNATGKSVVSFNVPGQFNTTKTVDKIYAELFELLATPNKFQTSKPKVHTHPENNVKMVELPGVNGYFLGLDKKVYSKNSKNIKPLRPYNVNKKCPYGIVSMISNSGQMIRFNISENLHLLDVLAPKPVTPTVKQSVQPVQTTQAPVGYWLKIPGSDFNVRVNNDNEAEVRSAHGNILVPYGKYGYVSVMCNGKRIQDTPQNFWDATVALSHNNSTRPAAQTKPVQQSLPLQVSPKASARFTKPENNSRLEVVDGKAVIVPTKAEVPKVEYKSVFPKAIQPKQEIKSIPMQVGDCGKMFLVPNGVLFAFKISPISDNVWHQIFKDQQELQHVKSVIDVASENLGMLTRGKTIATVAQKLGFQRSTDLEFSAKFNIVPKRLAYNKKL